MQFIDVRKLLDQARAKAGGTVTGLALELGLPRTTVESWFLREGKMSLLSFQRLHQWMDRELRKQRKRKVLRGRKKLGV